MRNKFHVYHNWLMAARLQVFKVPICMFVTYPKLLA